MRAVDWCNLLENWTCGCFKICCWVKGWPHWSGLTTERSCHIIQSMCLFKKWMCTYPNDSIIVINYPAHVISTIWQLLWTIFSFLWVHTTHTSLIHSRSAQTHPTHSHACPTPLFEHHNPLTYSHTTNTPINYSHSTRTSPPTHSIITHVNPVMN